MDSKVLAPRPPRSNWGRVIYNVLHDNGNRALAKPNIWALVPQSMHLPHSYKRFTAALNSMLNHHFLEGRGVRGNKLFRIATAEAHTARQAVMAGYRRNAPKKKVSKKKRQYKTRKAAAASTRLPNALETQLEVAITDVQEQIAVLQSRGAKLIAMRKLAGEL